MTRTMVELSKKERRNTGGSKTRTAARKLATKRDGHLKLHVPSESGGEEEHDDFEDVDENDDDEEDEEKDEDVSEEGMKILMTLVGEEDLDEFEKAQLAIEDEETDEEEEDDENEELDDKEEGSLADGEDDEDESEDEEMEGVRCCVSYPFDGILYANSIRSAKTSSRGFHHRIPNRPRRCTPR